MLTFYELTIYLGNWVRLTRKYSIIRDRHTIAHVFHWGSRRDSDTTIWQRVYEFATTRFIVICRYSRCEFIWQNWHRMLSIGQKLWQTSHLNVGEIGKPVDRISKALPQELQLQRYSVRYACFGYVCKPGTLVGFKKKNPNPIIGVQSHQLNDTVSRLQYTYYTLCI
jgi:hypothetical protein